MSRRFVEFGNVYIHRVADLLTQERCTFLVVHADQTDIGLFDLVVALFEGNLEGVFLLDAVDIYQLAVTVHEVGAVAIPHFILDLDVVFGDLVLFAELDCDLRSDTHFENELIFGIVVEVERLLFFTRNHVAHEGKFLLFDVVDAGFRCGAIGLLGNDPFAVHLVDDSHRNHARTETRNVGFAFVGPQCFVYRFVVVGFSDGYLEQGGEILKIFSYNIHRFNIL